MSYSISARTKESLVGKKFVARKAWCTIAEGEIVEVTRIDSDGDIVVTGARDYHYMSSLRNFDQTFERYLEEFETNWIVWNVYGSVTASSEEEAKKNAETLLKEGADSPVYLAKAQAKAEINAVVWTS